MIESIPVDQTGQSVEMSAAPMSMSYKIKRMGARPLQVNGSELGMAMSFTPSSPYWYEINILRTVGQEFVLVIKLFFQSENETDTVQAWECETFGEVMDILESYDAANDVRIPVDMDDPSLSAPEMAAWAMDLRARAVAARTQFRGLVGELLHDLETG